jgi:hypothetical protein
VSTPLPGSTGTLCELDKVIARTFCSGEALGPALRSKITKLRRVLRRISAGGATDTLLDRAATLVEQSETVADRRANRGRISPTCGEDLGTWLADVDDLIDQLRP